MRKKTHVLQCSLEGRVLFIVFSKTPDCHRFRKVSFIDVDLVFHLVYLPSALLRWCLAFLFDPLSMRRTLRRMCASLLMFCASSGRAGSGVRIRYLTRVRAGLPFGSRECSTSPETGPASDAEMSCLRNWFSHSTSTSASPVPPGFSVTGPSTNAANTDTKGCPTWCPFCPFASPLRPTPWSHLRVCVGVSLCVGAGVHACVRVSVLVCVGTLPTPAGVYACVRVGTLPTPTGVHAVRWSFLGSPAFIARRICEL